MSGAIPTTGPCLYDATRNITKVYNELLSADPAHARDIQLSQGVEVNFEDFINNYWPHLEFMILSKPDFAHTRLMEHVQQVEDFVKERMAEGEAPLAALEQAGKQYKLDPATLSLLRRDKISPEQAALETFPLKDSPFESLYQAVAEGDDTAACLDCLFWMRSMKKISTSCAVKLPLND